MPLRWWLETSAWTLAVSLVSMLLSAAHPVLHGGVIGCLSGLAVVEWRLLDRKDTR